MPYAQSPIFDRIGKMLHAHFDEMVDEPLPKRWVDLIKYLNEKEREDEARRQRQKTVQPGRSRALDIAGHRADGPASKRTT